MVHSSKPGNANGASIDSPKFTVLNYENRAVDHAESHLPTTSQHENNKGYAHERCPLFYYRCSCYENAVV